MRTTLDEFLSALGSAAPRTPATRLRSLLGRFDRGAPLADRLDWVEELGDWVLRSGGRIPAQPELPAEPQPTRRLRLLVRACEQVPEAREVIAGAIGSVLSETSAVRLLTETGLPRSHGFVGELAERVVRGFLPVPRTDRELADLVPRMFAAQRHVEWLVSSPRALLASFAGIIASDGGTAALRGSVVDAIELLAMRAAVIGMADDVRARGPHAEVATSPFRTLHASFVAMCARARAGQPESDEDRQTRADALRECRAFVRSVLTNLERSGVSVDLVFRLETLNKSLLRLERMTQTLQSVPGEAPRAAAELFSRLLSDAKKDRSVISLVHANIRQLSRKIVERAGESGEHYITSSRAEWRHMLSTASGGGLLTSVTAIVKLKAHALHLPLFFEGFVAGANYAGSFVTLQLLGLTLATKQPSMTAAALAHELSEKTDDDAPRDLRPLVDQIARINRSQLAAAFANVLMVVFAACVIETVLFAMGREPVLDPKTAKKTIASLHPFATGTIFFAGLTGVILWASSVAGGWFDNWAVYQRLPEGLASSRRLRRVVGAERARRFAAWFAKNLAGFGGNVSLGFMLGMTPVIGQFFGLPLEVRHVTLSMGSLAFAGFGLVQTGLPASAFLWALAGIAVIGLMNFAVSFALALEVALRARDVDRTGHWALFKAVVLRLRQSPREFVLPPVKEVPQPAPLVAPEP